VLKANHARPRYYRKNAPSNRPLISLPLGCKSPIPGTCPQSSAGLPERLLFPLRSQYDTAAREPTMPQPNIKQTYNGSISRSFFPTRRRPQQGQQQRITASTTYISKTSKFSNLRNSTVSEKAIASLPTMSKQMSKEDSQRVQSSQVRHTLPATASLGTDVNAEHHTGDWWQRHG